MTTRLQRRAEKNVGQRCTRKANAPIGSSASARATTLIEAVYATAMMTIAMRSSTTASVSRNVRNAAGRWDEMIASTARANAMSVAAGTAQPRSP
jgi:hypothetical protein